MSTPDLQTWFQGCEETIVKIWIENPEILQEKKFGLQTKSYTTFRVLMKSSSGDLVGVRHRYSEFETLRENLRDRYLPLGIFVPQLPAKKILNNTDSEFIKERMQGLTLFCEGIVANPFLRHDKAFREFMDMKDSDRNMGETMLGSSFARLPDPINPLVRYMVLREEVAALEKHTKAVYEASRAAQQAYAAMVQSNTAMQSALSGWGNFEQETVRALNGKYNGQQDPVMREADGVPKILNRMSVYYSEQHGVTADMPDYAGVLMTPAYEYEYNRCCAFLELFKYHDDLSNFIDKQRSKVEKMDRSKLDKLTEAQAILEEKKICLSAFYKGLMFFSIPMQARDRSMNLRRCASFSGATMLVSSGGLQKASFSLMRDLEINPASAVANTSVILEQLSLKTLDATNEMITASTWAELPPLTTQCYGLLRSGMGLTQTGPSSPYAAAAPLSPDSSIAALMKKAAIQQAAAREDPFEEDDMPAPPPVPTTTPVFEAPPPIPTFQPDQEKVSSLLGDLTGEAPTGSGGDNLWS